MSKLQLPLFSNGNFIKYGKFMPKMQPARCTVTFFHIVSFTYSFLKRRLRSLFVECRSNTTQI